MCEIALGLDVGSLLRYGFRNRLKCHLLQSNSHGFRNPANGQAPSDRGKDRHVTVSQVHFVEEK